MSRVVFVASASDGSCRSALSSCQITGDALLKLDAAPFHLRPRIVPIAIVYCLELAAVDRNTRRHKQTHLPAEFDKARAHLADRTAVVFSEIGNRFMVGDEPAKQPHQLDIAAGFALEPPARLHPVEIAVDIELQQSRGMISRPPSLCRLDPFEPELGEIEHIDERVNRSNRIVLVDPVVEAFRKQRRLSPLRSLNETLHSVPRNPQWIIACGAFSHSQGQTETCLTTEAGQHVNG